MERLGFPTLQHLALTLADFTGDEDVVELAGQWADALSEQKAQEEQRLLEAVSPPRDGPVFFNPFGRSSPAQSGSSPEGEEASTSGQGAGDQTAAKQGAVIDVEAESLALAQPWGRRLWDWAQAAGLDAHSGVFVAKPGGVGRGDRPGANVVMARGLPAAALAARDLMEQVGSVVFFLWTQCILGLVFVLLAGSYFLRSPWVLEIRGCPTCCEGL